MNGPFDRHIKTPITLCLILCNVEGWAIVANISSLLTTICSQTKFLKICQIFILISILLQENPEPYTLSSQIKLIKLMHFGDHLCKCNLCCSLLQYIPFNSMGFNTIALLRKYIKLC